MNQNKSQTRINQQIRNMLKQPLEYLKATPLQNDIYTWHFTIQGPQNSDFHEGLYHGQILLPFQYPFKPPDMIFMNKNGRFQVNTKICLTITQYHPEDWNPSWTIRTMLQAVVSLFNQKVMGIGYEEGSKQMRKQLALKSHNFKCEKCGLLKDILKPRQSIKEENKQISNTQNYNNNNNKMDDIQRDSFQFINNILKKVKDENNSKNQQSLLKKKQSNEIRLQNKKVAINRNKQVKKQQLNKINDNNYNDLDKQNNKFDKIHKLRQQNIKHKKQKKLCNIETNSIKLSPQQLQQQQQQIQAYRILKINNDNLALDKKSNLFVI